MNDAPDADRQGTYIVPCNLHQMQKKERLYIMGNTYTAHCQSGYYGYDRLVHVTSRLREHPYAQCGIIKKDNTIFFVSYETIVCEIDADSFLHCYGTFSATTAKQIGWFFRQMRQDYNFRVDLANYQIAKMCYLKNVEINLYNGDKRPASSGMIQTIGIRKGW